MIKRQVMTITLMLIVSAGCIWGQNLPGGIWSSPQSTTTEGRIRSNADDFIRPDAYTNVKMEKWFGMTAFMWDADFNAIATAGAAVNAGNVYLAAFYNGNSWANKPVNNYTEMMYDSNPPQGAVENKIYHVYNNINLGGVNNPVNNAALLFGFANMGIRLTYRTNYQSFKESNIVTNDQLYKNYERQLGYMIPQFAWAMAKNLTSIGLKPYVTLDLGFERDYHKTQTEGPDSYGNTGAVIERSLNHMDPVVSAGLGGLTFYKNEKGFNLSADLDYVLTMNIYNNEYSYTENDIYKTASIKGTYSPGMNPYIERSYASNLITPSLSGSWNKEKLSLRFKLNLPFTVINEEQNSLAAKDDDPGKLIANGYSYSTSTFTFRPDVRLAMRYYILPNKLALTAGARVQATAINRTKVNQIDYDKGELIDSRVIHQNTFGGNFINRFSLGTTVNFTENVWLEATTGVTNIYGENAIEIFAPGGLFSFGSILVVLKF